MGANVSFSQQPTEIMDELIYQSSFGNLPNKTIYHYYPPTPTQEAKSRAILPWENKSLTTASNLFAIGTSYTATSGSIPVLIPTIVDSTLYDVTRRDTPLASGLLARVSNRGLFADYVKRTVLPTAKFRAEGAALDATESTYTRAAQPMSYMYATGDITGPMMVASRVWQDALALETEAHFRSLKELEEDTIINGNPTADDTTGGTTDENAFTGLIQGITTNTLNKSGAGVTIPNLRTSIRTVREAKGHPNLIVTDYKSLDDIKALIQDQLRYEGTTNIAWGIESVKFEGIPIIPDLFMPTTAAARELLVLDTQTNNNIQLRVLQEATLEELAKNADSFKFTVKQYMTMIIVHEAWCYRIYGLE